MGSWRTPPDRAFTWSCNVAVLSSDSKEQGHFSKFSFCWEYQIKPLTSNQILRLKHSQETSHFTKRERYELLDSFCLPQSMDSHLDQLILTHWTGRNTTLSRSVLVFFVRFCRNDGKLVPMLHCPRISACLKFKFPPFLPWNYKWIIWVRLREKNKTWY